MAETWSLKEDQYILSREPPPGLDGDSKLAITLDEFYLYDRGISVEKLFSRETRSEPISIKKAALHLRRRKAPPVCFILHISSHDRIDALFVLPKIILDNSLFYKYWPNTKHSNYFKQRNKLFYSYLPNYVSPPTMAYGGATEWLYIMSGVLELTLIEPTDLNLCKYSQFSDGEEFKPESNTSTTFTLQEESFMVIPAGHISIKKALKVTCAYGGELLHDDNLSSQIGLFQRDVMRTAGIFAHERDKEIRHMYWFYASHLLQPKSPIRQDGQTIRSLLSCLIAWKLRYWEHDVYTQPDLYAPFGIAVDAIVIALKRRALRYPETEKSKGEHNELKDTLRLSS